MSIPELEHARKHFSENKKSEVYILKNCYSESQKDTVQVGLYDEVGHQKMRRPMLIAVISRS